jgi:LysR family transcriptional regulator, glycine cleavage system transcriptional activator
MMHGVMHTLRSATSIACLRAFVETARWQSFTRAAETLRLTQSAVSKQVQLLEQQIGVRLLRREARGLSLTASGNAFLAHASEALATLAEGEARARQLAGRGETGGSIELSASPAFAAHWLIPLLPRFVTQAPATRLQVRPRLPDFSPMTERFDMEIRLGRGRWPDSQATYLLGREMALVASPKLLAGRDVHGAQDLAALPLLQRAQRGYGWDEWADAAAADWDRGDSPELLFEGFSVLIPAAIAGCGLAICPLFLVLDALERGDLVRPLGETVTGASGYYAVVAAGAGRNSAREQLLEWLLAQARETSARVAQLDRA